MKYILLSLLIVATSSVAFAKNTVIPLLSGHNKVYVAIELEIEDSGNFTKLSKDVVNLNNQFIKLARVDGAKNFADYFNSSDGSKETVLASDFSMVPFKLYRNSKGSDYKNVFVIGGYRMLGVEYLYGSKELLWREDFYCNGSDCRKSVVTKNQLLEFGYSFYYQSKPVYTTPLNEVMGPSSKVSIYNAPVSKLSNDSFRLAIQIDKPAVKYCPECELSKRVEFIGPINEQIYSQFFRLVEQVSDVSGSAKLMAVLKGSTVDFVGSKAIPVLDWEGDRPALKHVDYNIYADLVSEYGQEKPAGYILDDSYAYLFFSKTTQQKGKVKESFQIFVLKEKGDDYWPLPHTDKKLATRALMFHDDMLEFLLKEIIR